MRRIAIACAVGAALGCADQSKMYRWGGYDSALYDHYKNPQERDVFVARLQAVIEEAEKSGSKVPPGCYAEYGWALLEQGRAADAVAYFEKESQAWPESRAFMEKLVRVASRSRTPAPAAVPASATGETK